MRKGKKGTNGRKLKMCEFLNKCGKRDKDGLSFWETIQGIWVGKPGEREIYPVIKELREGDTEQAPGCTKRTAKAVHRIDALEKF
jgi:hypothetical protein